MTNKTKAFSLLLAGTFLSSPAVAAEIAEINADYLNNLTLPNVTWQEVSDDRTGVVEIQLPEEIKYFNYIYRNANGYEETGSGLNNNLTADNATGKLFKEIGNRGVYIRGKDFSKIDITSDFVGNYVQPSSDARGGAVYNGYTSSVGNITGSFVNNHIKSTSSFARGGAVYNYYYSVMGNITGDFVNNYTQASSDVAYGGAVYNDYSSSMGNITGNFIGNYVLLSSAKNVAGGAVYNAASSIKSITGDFIGNYAQGSANVYGGAVHNTNKGIIGNISGNFISNYADGLSPVFGGAIYNSSSSIGNITGDFINNYAQSTSSSGSGGAVYNAGSAIGNITGDFVGNHIQASSSASGGAIYNNNSSIEEITGDFTDNHAESSSSSARGGAVYNAGTISEFLNSNFIGNYVKGNDGTAGGAIWASKDILITADDGTSLFSENKANDKSNAIYMSGTTRNPIALNLSAVNKGTITFDDGIDGKNYNINVTGDGSGVVKFNNLVENVTNFTFGSNSITHLGLNGVINAQNMTASAGADLSSPIITVDVEVDKAANKVNSGAIHVADDISGDYRVLVNALNSDVLDNKDDAVVPFLFAPEDKEDTASSFSVARVIGSPYLWDGSVNSKGEETGSTWYLNLTDKTNPDYKPEDPDKEPDIEPVIRPIAPEVIAGAGLHEAAIEQTRSVVRNVRNKVASGREYCPNCGIYSAEWDGKQLRNVWVLAQGETATIDKPVKMDADIWGIEAGFDVQNDVNNTLGVFASYRKGEYDLSGKADKLHSNIGSEIDIDSYLAGLYYRYDKNMNWLFAAVYGGIQQADAKTDDGIAKFDTDGIEFGAGIETGHTFALSSDLTLDPSLGLYYTQVNFDDAKDNVGKEYDWKDVKHLEAELGVKLEKQIDYAKIYVKPSVIQTITSGDSVKITGLNKLSTYDDQTLGRIELGGRYGFTDALSAYGWVNYTFGSDYDATAFGAGVSYAW